MKRQQLRELIIVGFFVIVTGVVMGSWYNTHQGVVASPNPSSQNPPEIFSEGDGVLSLSGHLVQEKIFSGGDGRVSIALTMYADDVLTSDEGPEHHVDMMIVLDQSGSMRGQKIEYARQAVSNLLSSLSSQDRFAIIGYSDGVWRYTGLQNMTDINRDNVQSLIYSLGVGGNTNLGAGLQEGINTLLTSSRNGNVQKVILISDGLANRGIIEPHRLGNMASIAIEQEFAISTVGVGNDFNEQLMTTIADKGAGNYYYLANPQTFAQVFHKEFQDSKTVAARALEIRVPLPEGVSLVEASGYPITVTSNHAIVHPGDLLSGQTRKLFLTLQFPTHSEASYELDGVNIQYTHKDSTYTAALSEPFRVSCVNNAEEAVASIDQDQWEDKVLQEDFNALREQVAVELKNGKKQEALQQIDTYHSQQQLLNTKVGSAKVTSHLNEELDDLRDFVEKTFSGGREEIQKQQKENAKDLQFRGYKERRAK